ncbi:sulfatase [Lentisphaera profundi]|uniref:Sulfatase n=1 Tax=Lentisphaera profundi TaxID=1658616 RepID=A0ABY7VZ76_9BACT|nr:sulfatase [Lentisphaera profundi]WDE99422.1 sulfatase [Lentisphaera profundi]
MNIFKILVGLIVSVSSLWAEQASAPNVVMILSDDQGYADYSFMGHEFIATPRIDKLASASLVYERGYVTTAVCCPSISTMLTGLYPHQHGTTGNDPIKGVNRKAWIDKFRNSPQLPRLLGEAGYLSMHTGKYWHGDPAVSGFTDSMGLTQRHGSEYSLSIGRKTMQPIYDFIQKSQDQKKPFFVWFAPFMPHTPHTPPERLEKKYQKLGAKNQSKYYAMCEWFDESCGELLDHLDEKGLTENTVIVYICDNGWGSMGSGSVKASPHELGVRTPIMIKWPGKVSAQLDKVNMASNIDLVPTILAACGVEIPKVLPGINLLDIDAVGARKNLFLECFTHDMLAIDQPEAGLRARSYVDKQWKLTVWRKPHTLLDLKGWQKETPQEEIQLFNIKDDPMQKNNLAAQHPEKVGDLMKELNRWWNPGPVKNSVQKTQ